MPPRPQGRPITQQRKPRKPQTDLSTKKSNPTSAITQAYNQIMDAPDDADMEMTAINVVKPLVGHGMSEQNYQKFVQQLRQARERGGKEGIQFFLTNYILASSGMRVESREDAVASMLTEDINEIRRFTPEQLYLKELVESHVYNVGFIR